MSSIPLKRTNHQMPTVGLGLWKISKDKCADTVYQALKMGYRLLDCAADYGNEAEAGEGLSKAIADGIVKREEVFVTSKLWCTFHSREHAKAAAKRQLRDWKIDYFDLYLIHFPISLAYVDPNRHYPPGWYHEGKRVELANVPIQETWQALEELVDEGVVKNIGLSNFQGSLILDIFRYSRYQPQVLQIEIHPYLSQQPLVKLCREWGIAVTAYSSFGPQSYIELGMGIGVPSLLENDTVKSIASEHNATPPQVLLRWATQREIAVIPKSNSLERLASNLQCNKITLTDAQWKLLDSLNNSVRLNDPADIDSRLGIYA